MSKAVCPYLCAPDANKHLQPPIDYPSFENCCRVVSHELLLLADQATFCLSGEHHACPRFVEPLAQVAAGRGLAPAPLAVEPTLASATDPSLSSVFAELPLDNSTLFADRPAERWRGAWIGAAVIFAAVLLCGGSWAAYIGWQIVSERALAARPGRIETLAGPPTAAAAPFLVVTATSALPVAPTPTSPPLATPTPLLVQPTYPEAVTPTPIVVQVAAAQSAAGAAAPVAEPLNATQLISVESPPNVELPTPAINLQLEIPTRRPTPIVDLPTSTPVPLEPTPSPTPTVILGTPVVLFGPVKKELLEGECTLLRWHVENVRAVYYENQGVNGVGEDEECIEDQSLIYSLLVVLGDGSQKTYTTTLTYLPPTATPKPTPSFTPELTPESTPTWTPSVPTDTPTPDVAYGVNLTVFGDSQRTCSPGSDCDFEFLVTNTGTGRDDLVVNLTATGSWPAVLCTEDGTCADRALTVSAVEAGNGKRLKLSVKLPSDAAGQAGYSLQAASLGSGGSATSNSVGVEARTP